MLDLEYRNGTVVIRFRPAPRGILTAELLDSVAEAIAYVGGEFPLVLTGSGGVFAPDLDPREGPARHAASSRLPRVLRALRTHPLPVVAAVNGDATGAGYLLARAADLRIMSGGLIRPTPNSVPYGVAAAAAAGLVEHRSEPRNLLDAALRRAGGLRRTAIVTG